ncbi:hypothetical protein TEA_013386 [Camellia sinensis var. sinensis]|uniref:Uncharacterized protein n=1 Tax=Camellia sinensis var. sinensis TaxID=542762 RepID=A0A4S4D489_CAMSN|nr:hypothetical protein TEA_013386 [Camellia sinensis var. sinensis]
MATLCLASQVKGSIHKQPIPHRIGELKTSLSSTVKPFIQELEKLPMRIDVSKTIKSVTLRILDAFVDSVFQFVDQPVLPSQHLALVSEDIFRTLREMRQRSGVSGFEFMPSPPPTYPPLQGSRGWRRRLMKWRARFCKSSGSEYSPPEMAVDLSDLRNFVPVEEIGHIAQIEGIVGEIPADFPEGVYIRNDLQGFFVGDCGEGRDGGHLILSLLIGGLLAPSLNSGCSVKRNRPSGANPLWGGLKSTISVFGKSSHVWVEGEGMLHALYFSKDTNGNWSFAYNNRFVEPKTFKMEKQRNKPSYLPAVEGDSPAILAAFVLNALRFGDVNKILSNTSVFEHGGKYYSIAENYLAQEIDISSLSTLDDWDLGGAWGRPFTTHPKKAPGSGELVIMGVDAVKPYYVVGVISADGKKLIHKADVKLKRSTLAHEIGITQNQSSINFYLSLNNLMLFNAVNLLLTSCLLQINHLLSIAWNNHILSTKGHFGNPIKMEHHKFAKNNFCTGSAYVSKPGGSEEDDGWIVAYVHDEDTDTSHVIVVDAKNFQGEPIAKIPLPQRVPYGHHGAYFQTPSQH